METSQEGPWAVCLDSKYSLAHKIHSKPCRVYSLGSEQTHTEAQTHIHTDNSIRELTQIHVVQTHTHTHEHPHTGRRDWTL